MPQIGLQWTDLKNIVKLPSWKCHHENSMIMMNVCPAIVLAGLLVLVSSQVIVPLVKSYEVPLFSQAIVGTAISCIIVCTAIISAGLLVSS